MKGSLVKASLREQKPLVNPPLCSLFLLRDNSSLYQHTHSLLSGTFRELGPPDLCHIVKANAKPGIREVSYSIFVNGPLLLAHRVQLGWQLPLCIGCRCFIICNTCRLLELVDVFDGTYQTHFNQPCQATRGE